MKKIFTLLVCAALFSSCGSSESSTGSSDSSTTGSAATSSENAATSKWKYEEETDKMTSGKKFYASIESDNKIEFEFPYDGGSNGTITVRKTGKKNEVLLGISKGQFNTSLDGTPVKVKFDDKKPITFNCSGASDGSSDVLFIENAKKFIAMLKASKKMIVQAEFYESGLKEMEFETKDFKWSH